MISVEQHHLNIPGMQHKQREPVHYAATRNKESGKYTINTQSIDSDPGIIGNILIAESAHTSAEQIHKILAEDMGPSSSTLSPKDHHEEEPEHWIRKALRSLHEHKVVESFNVDEFMTFAHGYMANRNDGEAPALIAYPKIHKDHEKKASKHKFWVSHPMAERTKTNSRGEASVYGGLM